MDIDSGAIKSTFAQLGPRHWEGTHVYEQVIIVRTFRNTDPGILNVDTRYYADGRLVNRLAESYRVLDDENKERPHSYGGKSIDEFARNTHYTNLILDIDIALDRV